MPTGVLAPQDADTYAGTMVTKLTHWPMGNLNEISFK